MHIHIKSDMYVLCALFLQHMKQEENPNNYIFHVVDSFPVEASITSYSKPGHSNDQDSESPPPPVPDAPSGLTGSMSMRPMTTRSCQLWFAPSSAPQSYSWLSFLLVYKCVVIIFG